MQINTAIENMTEAQKNELLAIVKRYANIKGDYEDTVWQGIAGFRCDSGINSDAFSVSDRKWVDANLAHLLDEDGFETDEYFEALHKAEHLDWINADGELCTFAEKYNFCDEDVATLCEDMERGVA